MWLFISSHEKEKNWIPSLNSQSWKAVFLVVQHWLCTQNSGKRTRRWRLCAKAQMFSIKGEGDQLPPSKCIPPLTNTTSVFHRVRWVFLACSPFMQSHQSCLHLLNLFHWEHSCSFWDTGLFFLLTAITTMHMTLEMRYLFRSSYSGCLPTSPSVYPAHRPASCLSSVLWCTSLSRSAAARMGLPWS